MKIIVLGATGMLGFQVFRECLKRKMDVHAIVRDNKLLIEQFGNDNDNRLHLIDDIKNVIAVEKLISDIQPAVIINCIGIVKQLKLADDFYESIAINSLLPHQLAKLCEKYNCRLVHISTDCVFDGVKGFYKETDPPNAIDLYGKSKNLGEVNYGHGITLRTSIIGHELTQHPHGLLEWFLMQNDKAKGFTKAIFSGLTTLELARVILDIVVPQHLSAGVYHVAAAPISKYDLLKIISEVYNKFIEIEPSPELVIDRSLDGNKFATLTNYKVPSWGEMISEMQLDFKKGF